MVDPVIEILGSGVQRDRLFTGSTESVHWIGEFIREPGAEVPLATKQPPAPSFSTAAAEVQVWAITAARCRVSDESLRAGTLLTELLLLPSRDVRACIDERHRPTEVNWLHISCAYDCDENIIFLAINNKHSERGSRAVKFTSLDFFLVLVSRLFTQFSQCRLSAFSSSGLRFEILVSGSVSSLSEAISTVAGINDEHSKASRIFFGRQNLVDSAYMSVESTMHACAC